MSEATKDTFYGGMSKSRSEMTPVATSPRMYSSSSDSKWPEWCADIPLGTQLFTADQLKEAQVEVLREAASKTFCNADRYMLLGMAVELERRGK